MARTGLGNGAFEDGEEEAPAIVEEFYPEAETGAAASGQAGGQTVVPITTKLTNKLAGKDQVAAHA